MIKYKASQILDRAISLADLHNTNFITWGDKWQMLNSSYRKIYQDMINVGDLNYLQEVKLLTKGTAKYELPDDFYKLAMLSDEFGTEIPMLPLANNSKGDWGYRIVNNTILLQNVTGDVVMKYYPLPETITFKRERTGAITLSSVPTAGFGENVKSGTSIINITTGSSVATNVSVSNIMLGKDAYCNLDSGQIYWFNNSAVDTISNPLLTTSGSFVSSPYGRYGWCNDDVTAVFSVSNGTLYFNEDRIGTISTTYTDNRCIYWNGKWALLTRDKIIYEDGSWETTDSYQVVATLKADSTTGYGYLVRTGYNTYVVEGWTPDTTIDYPDNILFDLVAYDLAIQFRVKQNADATQLKTVYNQLEDTYYKSLDKDDQNFITIRNVNKNFSRWSIY